jgi:hypothetical protein
MILAVVDGDIADRPVGLALRHREDVTARVAAKVVHDRVLTSGRQVARRGVLAHRTRARRHRAMLLKPSRMPLYGKALRRRRDHASRLDVVLWWPVRDAQAQRLARAAFRRPGTRRHPLTASRKRSARSQRTRRPRPRGYFNFVILSGCAEHGSVLLPRSADLERARHVGTDITQPGNCRGKGL